MTDEHDDFLKLVCGFVPCLGNQDPLLLQSLGLVVVASLAAYKRGRSKLGHEGIAYAADLLAQESAKGAALATYLQAKHPGRSKQAPKLLSASSEQEVGYAQARDDILTSIGIDPLEDLGPWRRSTCQRLADVLDIDAWQLGDDEDDEPEVAAG